MSKNKQHRPPSSSTNLQVSKAPTKSVGVPAIMESMKQMGRWMDMPKAFKASLKMNQKGGFDCPGCAWPDPDDERSSVGEYCENGIKALAEEATNKKADPSFFAQYSVQELSEMSDYELGKSGRITDPMYLAPGATHYKKISWDNAMQKMANQLKELDDPDEAIFYTSGRTSNEAAFMYGTFIRAFGTNNLPDCSNMCHESSGYALSKTQGIGKGSVVLSDIYEADLVIIMGQNPGTNHPRMLSALEKNKINGGTIVAVNPLKEAGLLHYTNPQKPFRMLTGGLALTDLYLQVNINGDLALLKAILFKLQQREEAGESIWDRTFIDEHTEGYDELKAEIQATDLEACIKECGIDSDKIDELVDLIAKKEKIIICWAMGLTQQVNGVATIQEIVNLLLLKGSIGKPGAGTCPVRGHSNVQGDRTMGIWEKMPDSFHEKLGKAFGFQSPTRHGYDTVESIKAMAEGKASFFFGMGGNFLSAAPDTDLTARALQQCDMTVHVSTKPNRSHLIHGKEALILPCKGRTEIDEQNNAYQFTSVENSMGKVHSSKGVLPPISKNLKSEVEIVCDLGEAFFGENHIIEWTAYSKDYDLIRDKIEEVIPGFEQFNTRIRETSGFYLPNPARDRRFLGEGRAKFTVNKLTLKSETEQRFKLMTLRSHDQYNTTIYGLNDRYRGISNGRKLIMMNMNDMIELGLIDQQLVHVHSYHSGKKRSIFNFRVVPYDIPRRCLAAYFPEANPLVSIDHVAIKSNTPVSKNITVKIEKATEM